MAPLFSGGLTSTFFAIHAKPHLEFKLPANLTHCFRNPQLGFFETYNPITQIAQNE
jgi:hypothetical protein